MAETESGKKQVPLRLSPKLYAAIAAWAEDDFRSVNGQIEYLLTECVRQRKKNGKYVSDELDKPPVMKRAQIDAFCGCRETLYQRIAFFAAPAILLAGIVYVAVRYAQLPAEIIIFTARSTATAAGERSGSRRSLAFCATL